MGIAALQWGCGDDGPGTDPDPPSPDITAPTVAIIAPGSDTVRATVTVAAFANDDRGVTGVTFFVDGSQLAPEDTQAPYTFLWNTVNSGNGVHSVSAIAKDQAGNWGLSPIVNYTVANGARSLH